MYYFYYFLLIFNIALENAKSLMQGISTTARKPTVAEQSQLISTLSPNVRIDKEHENKVAYKNMTLSFSRTLYAQNPAYAQILRKNCLTVTSFSVLSGGSINEFDLNSSVNYDLGGSTMPRSVGKGYLWPNELTLFRSRSGDEVLIVPDGFLTPSASNGGIFLIRNPLDPLSKVTRITAMKHGWFYHRAVHICLPSGQEGILTARATKEIGSPGRGELVWISLSDQSWMDGNDSHPLPETILAEGPDVMFEVKNRTTSQCLHIASLIFNKCSRSGMQIQQMTPFK
jgi:hypothetical protein